MTIMVSDTGGGNFTPHPEGSFNAVCVDVFDEGMVETQWGTKRKLRIYFFCGLYTQPNEEGVKFPLLVSQRFTATLNENGNLRPFLEKWRGKKFTPQELRAFDVEKLIGVGSFVQITHNVNGDKTYANIDAALKLPAGMSAPPMPDNFERRHIRDARKAEGAGVGAPAQKPWDHEDLEDLPF